MHYKKIFALAGVFLVVALVAPPLILILQTSRTIDDLIIQQNDPGHQTSGNITINQGIQEANRTTYLIIALIEVIFVILFVITLYYGINHIHPYH